MSGDPGTAGIGIRRSDRSPLAGPDEFLRTTSSLWAIRMFLHVAHPLFTGAEPDRPNKLLRGYRCRGAV